MNINVVYLLFFNILFIITLQIGELLYKRLKLAPEITRKLLHTSGALMCLMFPKYFTDQIYVLILGIEFLLVFLASKYFGFYQSVNNVKRKTYGSYFFPVAIYAAFLFASYIGNWTVFYLAVLLLAISDPMAFFVGYFLKKKKSGSPKTFGSGGKTFYGSLSFFLSAFIISLLVLPHNQMGIATLLLVAFAVSSTTTFTEAVSTYGTDNITIPVVAIAVLVLFNL
jgi:phytol kinase